MPEITIEHNPSEDRLKELGVANCVDLRLKLTHLMR